MVPLYAICCDNFSEILWLALLEIVGVGFSLGDIMMESRPKERTRNGTSVNTERYYYIGQCHEESSYTKQHMTHHLHPATGLITAHDTSTTSKYMIHVMSNQPQYHYHHYCHCYIPFHTICMHHISRAINKPPPQYRVPTAYPTPLALLPESLLLTPEPTDLPQNIQTIPSLPNPAAATSHKNK